MLVRQRGHELAIFLTPGDCVHPVGGGTLARGEMLALDVTDLGVAVLAVVFVPEALVIALTGAFEISFGFIGVLIVPLEESSTILLPEKDDFGLTD